MHGRALAIIATYEERANLPSLLDSLLRLPALDLLVIDDSSPDGTGQLAEERARTTPRLTVLHRPDKRGVTSAHVLGFQYALQHGYDLVVEIDADFSHHPADVSRLLAACGRADIAIGSRHVPGGRIVRRSRLRNVLTRFGNAYARFVLKLPIRDCTSGFRCTRRSALEAIDFSRIHSKGYGFQLELNQAWTKAGNSFAEVPVVFADRVHGESKMSARIVLEAFLMVVRLRLRLVPTALNTSRRSAKDWPGTFVAVRRAHSPARPTAPVAPGDHTRPPLDATL
jgi:dolichol-phosphate mannosyltransferase